MTIKLNKTLFNYLSDNFCKEKPVFKIKEVNKKENICIFIEIDEETADEIRDWAGDELQKRGFDTNYKLTPEGEMLEELVDLFFVQ